MHIKEGHKEYSLRGLLMMVGEPVRPQRPHRLIFILDFGFWILDFVDRHPLLNEIH